jgi:hypothetical protein
MRSRPRLAKPRLAPFDRGTDPTCNRGLVRSIPSGYVSLVYPPALLLPHRLAVWMGFLLASFRALTADLPPLRLTWDAGHPVLQAEAANGQRTILESSDPLGEWRELARVHGSLAPYPDLRAPLSPQRFYRVAHRPLALDDDWTQQLDPESGLFFTPATGSGGGLRSAKFTLNLAEPDRVYFQDTDKWPFHYPFARARLPGYASVSVLAFNQQSLYASAQQRLALGTVFRAPDPQLRELGLELTGAEPFPAALAARWVEAVRARIRVPPGWRFFYLPAAEQQAVTEAGLAEFTARGLAVDSLRRWIQESVTYSPGWTLGRLVSLPTGEIHAALADGRLKFGDILVTDGVPAELPILAGYLSREPATPNSHVALLARSLGLPFAYAHGAAWRAELASLNGREVLLIVEEVAGRTQIRLTDTTDRLSPARRQEILDLRRGSLLQVTPKQVAGTFALPVDPLTPADLPRVGGKAANFGFLRRSLPDSTPAPALALTFDLWDAFLRRPVPGTGLSLREVIQQRLARHTYPPDVTALRGDLSALQDLIRDAVDFAPAEQAAILAALQQAGFTPGRKLRFRSSTNVEDSEVFSGAGLYDSYSGCLADDLDAGTGGPSLCDPEEPKERGVFRAIRRVYASFYNENAFLERLRQRVPEADVGMAVLVHYSSPDPDETANGVATLTFDRSAGPATPVLANARVVTQLGAVSVTNPDGTRRAEVITAHYQGAPSPSTELVQVEASSLTPAGAPVMTWPADYRTLLDQLHTAALAYAAYFPGKARFELDFEFKRLQPGEVGLKQIREVPHPTPIPPPQVP